jgi:hypothetical protein
MQKEIPPEIAKSFLSHYTNPCTFCKKFWSVDSKTSCKDVCDKYIEWKKDNKFVIKTV